MLTYAESAATILPHHPEPNNPRSTEKILLVDNSNKNLSNSMEIKRAFANYFPNRRLVHAFRNSRGKIHLEFDSTATADEIERNGSTSALASDTSVSNPQNKLKENAIIINGVDTEIAENSIAEQLADQLGTETQNIKMRRFIKTPDVKMTTVMER